MPTGANGPMRPYMLAQDCSKAPRIAAAGLEGARCGRVVLLTPAHVTKSELRGGPGPDSLSLGAIVHLTLLDRESLAHVHRDFLQQLCIYLALHGCV